MLSYAVEHSHAIHWFGSAVGFVGFLVVLGCALYSVYRGNRRPR